MSTRLPPQPPGRPLSGHLLYFQRDSLRLLRKSRDMGVPVGTLRLGWIPLYVVHGPDLARGLLASPAVDKDTPSSQALRLICGESLLTANGDSWLRMRRLCATAFRPRRLEGYRAAMAACVERTLDRWALAGRVEVVAEMRRLTFEMVGSALFGADLEGEARTIGPAVDDLLGEAWKRVQQPWRPPLAVPTRANRRFLKALATAEGAVDRVLAVRRREGREDLASALLEARDEETGEALDAGEVRRQVLTFLLAGHDTTSSALAWTLGLLAATGQRPEDPLAAFHEALRLYPPIWILERRAAEDTRVGEWEVPRDSRVLVCPYSMQRDPSRWDDPDDFRPERLEPRPGPAWMPFGAGPRACLGAEFARLEARLVLQGVLDRFDLRLASPIHPAPRPGITLHPEGPLEVCLSRRPRG